MRNLKPISLIIVAVFFLNLFMAGDLFAKKRRSLKRSKASTAESVILVPYDMIEALQQSDIEAALRSVRLIAHSPQIQYLKTQLEIIETAKKNKKDTMKDRTALYNTGAAYHNLYLFLKSQDFDNQKLANEALKYYKLALRTKSLFKKNEINLAIASLYATTGKTKSAEKLFKKLDPELFDDPFKKYMGIALYYASLKDAANTITNLESAFSLNPKFAAFWLGISDDFTSLNTDPEFKSFIEKHKVVRLNRGPSIYSTQDLTPVH